MASWLDLCVCLSLSLSLSANSPVHETFQRPADDIQADSPFITPQEPFQGLVFTETGRGVTTVGDHDATGTGAGGGGRMFETTLDPDFLRLFAPSS